MAKSEFGLKKVSMKKKASAPAPDATTSQEKRPVITHRIDAADRKALKLYAMNNDRTVQSLIDEGLRLLAVERDIDLSDSIMNPDG